MRGELLRKVDRLVREYFPWGQDGFPASPPPASKKARREAVLHWLREELCLPFGSVALALVARVAAVIRELEAQRLRAESSRLLARIDGTCLVKSPESIVEKMVRNWRPGDSDSSPIPFPSLAVDIEDLGRFRVVANFLSDAERIVRALERPYGRARVRLTPAQSELKREFVLRTGRFQNSVQLAPAARQKGERCYKGVFLPTQGIKRDTPVEVQVTTLLQEAWDKKDHFLVYEPRRRGEPPDRQHEIEIFAMSELLYVADLTFDRLRGDVLRRSSRSRGERRAPAR